MASATDRKDKSPSQVVREWVENIGLPIFQPYRDAITREEGFLDGDRYEINNPQEALDRRLTQIRGQETQDTIRQMASEATSRARSVEARLAAGGLQLDAENDAALAEVAVALVDHELRDPWKGFETRYYEAVLDSREKRLGVVLMDWDPGHGQFGEMWYRSVDPRRVMWEPGFDPHHPLCNVFIEQRRVPVDWIHDNYPETRSWLQTDRAMIDNSGRQLRDGVPLIRVAGGGSLAPNVPVEDGKAELWFCWYKNDRQYRMRDKSGGSKYRLAPENRYLACTGGCGYRSPMQGELRRMGKLGVELPDAIEGACPDCGGDLHLVKNLAEQEAVHTFARGRRMTIIAPFCSGAENDQQVYDGAWPITRARSFPGLFLSSYIKPRRPMGPSDVTHMWDQQVASDNLATTMLQRVFEHRDYWIVPGAGIRDVNGRRWEARDDQHNIIIRDNTAEGPLDVQHLNGTGLDEAAPTVYQIVQQKLTQYRGTPGVPFAEEGTKNIPVGTIQQLTRQTHVPLSEYNRRKNLELAKFYGVVYDYIAATYTPQRLTRLNIEGADILVRMWGEDMPNFDFVIEETPEFTGLEKARAEATQVLIQTALNPVTRPFLEVIADANNLPRSVVRKVQKVIQMQEQQAAAAAMEAASSGAAGDMGEGEPGMDPMLAALMGEGGNPGGMVPAGVA